LGFRCVTIKLVNLSNGERQKMIAGSLIIYSKIGAPP
jgi:hypothetical protein